MEGARAAGSAKGGDVVGSGVLFEACVDSVSSAIAAQASEPGGEARAALVYLECCIIQIETVGLKAVGLPEE